LLVATLDSSVVASGVGWAGGDARRVLVLLARRAFVSCAQPSWFDTVGELVAHERHWSNPNWVQWLDWLKRKSVLVVPAPLPPTVKRDLDDDVVLASALAGQARYLVTYDDDLVDLEKPFGIACVRPRQFLAALLRA
jgi:putative PIN family toxin of toxin-antitoxin system